MPGFVLLTPGVAGFMEGAQGGGPGVELAVGANYEQFDGLTVPPTVGSKASTYYGDPVQSREGPSNRGTPTPLDEQTYTPSPNNGLVNTLGGQPWPASAGVYRAAAPCAGKGPGYYTPTVAQSQQFRLGVGQHGPSELGVAQTVKLSEITSNPPEPGDLTSILAGLG
jgi:hypothetical protein